MRDWGSVTLVATLLLQFALTCAAHPRSLDEDLELKSKRPFCNAFTGCGRKRSGDAAVEPGTLATQEQITEIARHVLGQDRMLEQLQQKVELMRALACGYPELPADATYRRRRDVREPAHHGRGLNAHHVLTPLPVNERHEARPRTRKGHVMKQARTTFANEHQDLTTSPNTATSGRQETLAASANHEQSFGSTAAEEGNNLMSVSNEKQSNTEVGSGAEAGHESQKMQREDEE
ncbi:uncharacterized protein LOC108681798 [Hyalella azteca]|uniref:Uncharacterized protein LOC108681798 n=1 Tax=Hyalella azteca TaxID=294128 RepID=A0A8B7PLT2_HYAAZ|nr:uncharacterized protein LOC108681798 [Hyalella azteca]